MATIMDIDTSPCNFHTYFIEYPNNECISLNKVVRACYPQEIDSILYLYDDKGEIVAMFKEWFAVARLDVGDIVK